MMRSGLPVIMTAVCLAAAGCDALSNGVLVRRDLLGQELAMPMEKPQLTMRAVDGSDFNLRERTDGDVVLMFFGYTNCPDICPAHMHNLAAVLRKMSAADARRIHVVFVTTDPERDTGDVLRKWLADIDPKFIGLRPTVAEAVRLQSELGLPPAVLLAPKPRHEGNYDVGHSASVVAFTPDNVARYAYAAGTRQADWAHDLPLLLRKYRPARK
jgi:protein SCO1/2